MSDVGTIQRSVRFPVGLGAMIDAEAAAEHRNFSQMVVVLAFEALAERNRRFVYGAGLGEGEPSGDGAGSGAAPSAAVQAATAGAADTASSPSPSPALQGAGADGAARGGDPRGLGVSKPAPSSACSFDTPKGVTCKACGKKH